MGKHAAPRRRRVSITAPRKALLRSALIAGGLAVVTTGGAVATGVATGGEPVEAASASLTQFTTDDGRAAEERTETLSRSADRRTATDSTKAASLAAAADSDVKAVSGTVDAAKGDPKVAAAALLSDFGWNGSQFDCLDKLWTRESNWNPRADNPSSSAYGIPQALPGSKMASAGGDWLTNPVTQIKWGLGYIEGRYGSPCGAWGHSQARGWY